MDCEAKGKAQCQPIADTSSFQPGLTISCNTYACFYRKECVYMHLYCITNIGL